MTDLFDEIPALVVRLDGRGRVAQVNRRFEALTGWPREEVRGLDWFDTFVPKRDRERIREVFRRDIRGEPTSGTVNPILTRDGRERDIEWQNVHQPYVGVLCVGVDITARLRAEQAQAERQARHDQIVDTAPVGIFETDARGLSVSVNRHWCDLSGQSPAQAAGYGWLDTIHPDDRERVSIEWTRAVRGKRAFRHEHRLKRHDGTVIWALCQATAVRDEAGEISGFIGTVTDITKRVEAEAVVRESEARQRAFVANVSHELRTPVTAIKGFAETLRRGGLRDRRNRMRFVRIIEAHADRLGWIVEDLLTLSSLESARGVKPEPLRVAREVRSYLDSIVSITTRRRVRASCRAGARVAAFMDRSHFLQLLENLVTNAVKFNKPGGRVRVEARARGEWTELIVRDDGPGIAAEHLSRVFERFYRVEKGVSRDGSGLGLSIVRRIAEAHGGRAWVESVPGEGSAFHVTLPAKARSAPGPKA